MRLYPRTDSICLTKLPGGHFPKSFNDVLTTVRNSVLFVYPYFFASIRERRSPLHLCAFFTPGFRKLFSIAEWDSHPVALNKDRHHPASRNRRFFWVPPENVAYAQSFFFRFRSSTATLEVLTVIPMGTSFSFKVITAPEFLQEIVVTVHPRFTPKFMISPDNA